MDEFGLMIIPHTCFENAIVAKLCQICGINASEPGTGGSTPAAAAAAAA